MDEQNEKEYYREKILRMLDEYNNLDAYKYFCGFIEKKLEILKAGN